MLVVALVLYVSVAVKLNRLHYQVVLVLRSFKRIHVYHIVDTSKVWVLRFYGEHFLKCTPC